MDQLVPSSAYRIAIIGLGYVGLPLAMAFSKKYKVIGFDIDEQRVKELNEGIDRTREIDSDRLKAAANINITSDVKLLDGCNVYIVTVPTPLDAYKNPDLSFLIAASTTVAKHLKKDDLVIYESTVYPGCTEEDCVPVLEKVSGLVYNKDFYCGYSPERINPGDKTRDITQIKKVTSGSTPQIAALVDGLYASIITAGTHLAPSIKVAEAAKAIENAQRDVNISFMNEVALIFDRIGIDTGDVLEAAASKWNFLPFRPGLVGGHCIGVDPHYLAYKAIHAGYEPQVILSGRKVNEQMGLFVAEKTIRLLKERRGGIVKGCKALILGFAFKENCADTRNTKVVDIYRTLCAAGLQVAVYDPVVDVKYVKEEFDIQLALAPELDSDIIVLAVAHSSFEDIDFSQVKPGTVVFDAKGFLDKKLAAFRL